MDVAPRVYVEAISDIRWLGANVEVVLHSLRTGDDGTQFRKAEVILIGPTGGLPAATRLLGQFLFEHRIIRPGQDTG